MQLSARHRRVARVGRNELRHILIELDALFRAAPGSVHAAYKTLTEAELTTAQNRSAACFDGDKAAWTPSGDTPLQLAGWLGGLIREADRLLAYRRSQWPIEASEWFVDSADCWVIPRTGVSALRTARRRQGYDKRGLRLHRILPGQISGYRVDVCDSRTMHAAAMDSSKWKMAACLFENLTPVPTFSDIEGEKHFVVTEVQCPSAMQTVEDQAGRSLEADCIGVVWPELTVPAALRDHIVRQFSARPLADERQAPEFIVPGSWHEADEGATVNRARIYDGYGVERLVYDKIAPYAEDDWGREAIRPGERICVLATEGALLGLAICLDFCDVASTPFAELDVDLMLVPSMGNDRTMQGHQMSAAKSEVKFGTRSFVVQCITSSRFKDGRLGTILPLPKDPMRVPVERLGQKTTWQAYKWPPDT